jgi:hypothetical protein
MGLVSPSQLRDWSVGALADSVHVPGPRSGRSTDSTPAPSAPESPPLNAFAFNIGARCLTLVVVTLEKLLTTDDEVTGVFAATITLVDGVVVARLVVVVFGTWVVTGDVEEGGGDETSGARGAAAEVRVKTSIKSRSGLDHIKR